MKIDCKTILMLYFLSVLLFLTKSEEYYELVGNTSWEVVDVIM